MLVQGCNVVGHLGVGFMQINRTGTPLFFSARPGSLTAAQEDQLRQALAMAATGGAHAIPSDWLVNDCQEIWTDNAGTRRYSWYQPAGLEFSDMPDRYDGYLSAI